MIKKLWAKITRKGAEDRAYPIQQATYLGRVSDFFVLFPYGMHANLPVDQLGLIIDQKGRVFMGTSAVGRITVEEGEVVFYHPGTKSKTTYKNNGDIDMDSTAAGGDINLNAKNASIVASGDVSIAAAGDVDIEAGGSTTLTAPTVAVVGNLTVTGTVVSTGDVTGNGKTLSTHAHPYTWTDPAGSGTTGSPS